MKEDDGKDNNDSEWPSLWEDAEEMMQAAVFSYAFADLRSLFRQGKLFQQGDTVEDQLRLPIGADNVLQLFQNNSSTIQLEWGDETYNLFLDVLVSISMKQQENHTSQHIDDQRRRESSSNLQVVSFEDSKSEKELVYGIGLNHQRQRITIAFRGSVTKRDFQVDVKLRLANLRNPVPDMEGLPTLRVHQGFLDYLYGNWAVDGYEETICGWNVTEDSPKCHKLMGEILALMQEYPSYNLYLTGHSLGGALATLFAFEAAADIRFKRPVTCVTIASPKVGDYQFRRAFQELERRKKIRCLRIGNSKDIVTLLPIRNYWHVGIALKLDPTDISFSKPTAIHTWKALLYYDIKRLLKHTLSVMFNLPFLCCPESYLKYHSCQEYVLRLLRHEQQLRKLQLDTLYNDNSPADTKSSFQTTESVACNEKIPKDKAGVAMEEQTKKKKKKKKKKKAKRVRQIHRSTVPRGETRRKTQRVPNL